MLLNIKRVTQQNLKRIRQFAFDLFLLFLHEQICRNEKNAILEKGYNLYNNYGPTESTVDVLSAKCTEHPVVIGSPIANTQVYILSSNNNPVPIGVPGELHIAGLPAPVSHQVSRR